MIDLGGHGAYVWPAYGAAALVLLGLLLVSLRRLFTAERELARLQSLRRVAAESIDPIAVEDGRGDGG